MKRQNTSSRQVIIRVTFFATLLIMGGCKGGKQPVQTKHNIHSTETIGNTAILKENIGLDFPFTKEDPRGSSSPSFSPLLFLFFPFTYIITTRS